MSQRKIQDQPNGWEHNREKGYWSVVVPEDTNNLFPDPSFEASNANLTTNTSITSNTEAAFGQKAPKIQGSVSAPVTATYTFANTDGVFTPGVYYTWGFTTKCPGGTGHSFTGQVIWSNGNQVLGTLDWKASGYKDRNYITFLVPVGMTTGQSILLVIKKNDNPSTPFWLDAYQLEQKAYPTTYVDGDQTGCRWLGTPYASVSHRPSNVAGGRIYEFKKDLAFSIYSDSGAGSPPIVHQTLDEPVRGGQRVNRTLPDVRNITLLGVFEGRSEAEIEQRRDILEQVLMPKTGDIPDETPPPLKLRHTTYDRTTQKTKEVEITVYYVGGLEWDHQGIFQDRLSLQFSEFQPIGFVETSENYQPITFLKTLNTSNAYMKRTSGDWVALPRSTSPTSGVAMALAEDSNHTLWIADGSGTTYALDKIQSHPITGDKIVNTTSSYFNAAILALAPFNSGCLVGGSFNGAVPYIGFATGVGNTFNSVITLNGAVRALYVDPITGKIWIGGDFTGAGTGGASNRLIILNPDFSVYATINSSLKVSVFAPGPKAGQVYVGLQGVTGTVNGTSVVSVCLLTVTDPGTGPTITVDDMGVSLFQNYLFGDVYDLKVGTDGTLYAAGKWNTIGFSTGATESNGVAKYVNGHWLPMNRGLQNAGSSTTWEVDSLAIDKSGNVYAAGNQTRTPENLITLTPGYSMWDGNYWLPTETSKQTAIGTQKPLGKILITSDNRQIVTYESPANDNFYFAAANDIVNNGSAPSYPRIRLHVDSAGSTRIYKITNFSTKTEIYLNYLLSYQEILTLDFTPGQIDIVSSFSGSIKARIVSTSKLTSFRLQEGRNGAGKNRILIMTDGTNISGEIYWRTTYWGAAGGARP